MIAACLSHYEVESAGTDFAEPPVSIERDGDGDRRIVALETHSARNEKIVELVNVERLPGLAEEKGACLCDRAIGKAMADGFDVVGTRRNSTAALGIHVRHRVCRAVSRGL